MSATKTFDLRTILSVTTGRLLTKRRGDRDNGIGDLYELLGWMTGESPFTHQLPRFGEECTPWLLRWFPELGRAYAYLTDLDLMLAEGQEKGVGGDVVCDNWLAALTDVWDIGAEQTYDVPKIPANDHERKAAWDELVAMRGTDKGIVVVRLPEGQGAA